jgi:asparagine synthase (glutamine-hydrolysing)
MCGIVAVIRTPGAEPVDVVSMTDVLAHRGPDGEGYLVASRDDVDLPRVMEREEAIAGNQMGNWEVGLGHRRLAILDTSSAGAQPMLDRVTGRAIVHNGEIYNFIELRVELQARGYRFCTQTDTEVILAAYDAWGAECLQRFNGMWAFVILDWRKRELFAARDRLGIKPLYYTNGPWGLALASEIKAFTQLPHWRARMNPQRAYEFLTFGALDHTDETLFSGVKQLAAGHQVTIALGNDRSATINSRWKPWWRFPDFSVDNRPFDVAVQEFRNLFCDAVRLHLRSDVPVGSCLSGGIDSSAVVCTVNKLLRDNGRGSVQHTFSAVYPGAAVDESRFIDTVAKACQVDSRTCSPSVQDLPAHLTELIWTQDEPFTTTSIFAQWSVFASARKAGVTVMLDGQGADEQLAGYPHYAAAQAQALFSSGQVIEAWREAGNYAGLGLRRRRNTMAMAGDFLLPRPVRQFLRGLAGYPARPPWLSRQGLERLGVGWRYPYERLRGGRTFVHEVSRLHMTRSVLPMLLHYEDRNSMAHSIEARVPFLDHRLVAFLAGLATNHKVVGGETKRILRAALTDLLPPDIRNRRDKIGFATPEAEWMSGPLRQFMNDELDRATMRLPCLFVADEVRKFANLMLEGRRPYKPSLWRLVSFGRWVERFDVST